MRFRRFVDLGRRRGGPGAGQRCGLAKRTEAGETKLVGKAPSCCQPGKDPQSGRLSNTELMCATFMTLAVERTDADAASKDAPTFANWDQDVTAVENELSLDQDVNKISYELAVNAGKFADLLDKVRGDQWQRTGMRSDGSGFHRGQLRPLPCCTIRFTTCG